MGYDENRSGFLANRSGPNGNRSALGRPPVGGWSGGGRSDLGPTPVSVSGEKRTKSRKNALKGADQKPPSNAEIRVRTGSDEEELEALLVGVDEEAN